jgi:hypothetical protein
MFQRSRGQQQKSNPESEAEERELPCVVCVWAAALRALFFFLRLPLSRRQIIPSFLSPL